MMGPLFPPTTLVDRVITLEEANAINWQEYWESIASGTSGTLTIPDGHEILLNQWANGVDGVVSQIEGGVPSGKLALDAGGDPVTTTLNAAGAWAFSAAPVSYPVAIVFAARGVGGDLELGAYSETNNDVTAGATETIPITHRNHSYELTEACVFTAPTLPAAGVRESHVVDIASETFSTTWAASPAIRWATSDNLAPTLDTTAGTVSTITLRSNAAGTFWQGRAGGETVTP